MTEKDIEALWNQKLSVYEFAREIERLTLAKAAHYLSEFGDIQMTGIGAARQINALARTK